MTEFNAKDQGLVMFSWNNYFISTIQQGIQAGHCWVDMAVKYENEPLVGELPEHDQWHTFWVWAANHKTVNVRNGGDIPSIIAIINKLADFDSEGKLNYPFDAFYEDESQGGQITSVSIVIPEHVFAWEPEYEGGFPIAYADGTVKNIKNKLDEVDQYLYDLIKSTRHAQ